MKFDFENRNISLKEQFYIMGVILGISCLLFTFVYIFHSCSVSGSGNTESSLPTELLSVSPTEQSQEEVSAEVSETEEQSSNQSSLEIKPLENIKYIEKEHDEIYNGELILVNKDFECHHDGEDTVELYANKSDTYGVTDTSVYVNADIIDNMNSMMDDFADIYGYTDIMVACAYRSYALQVQLYNEEVENVGDSEAGQWVAPPGFSEHQTGYVFDLNLNIDNGMSGIKYDGEGIYGWINENCYKYGFILRYLKGKENITGYEYEPWHFRYVGLAHATYISDKEITLEEYIDIVHVHSIDNPLAINGENGDCWLVYYVEAADGATEVPVSGNYPYEISGDNYSGFIVTQKIK